MVNRIFNQIPPAIDSSDGHTLWDFFKAGFALRRLGKSTMLDLMRIAPMCVADWLNEWFDNSRLKAGLAGTGLSANFAGPWSPGSAFNLLLWECNAKYRLDGGPRALVAALEKAFLSHGGEIRTAAQVNEIRIEKRQIKGVVLKDGDPVRATIVAASCDPRHTFLDLVPGNQLENWQERRIQLIRGTGTIAKVNLALSRPLEFKGRSGQKIAFARTGHHLDHIEKAFDACKYGRFSTDPILDIHIPTVSDPNLAPAGHCVVSILVHFVPYRLQTRWDRDQTKKLGDTVVNALEQYAPGLADAIVASPASTPVVGNTGYTACTANESGCNRNDLPVTDPVGTMIVAVRTPEETRARTLRMPGDRERVRTYTTTAALHLTRLALEGVWWGSGDRNMWAARKP